MDLFVIEVRGKPVAVINAEDRLHAEQFAASLDGRRRQMKDCEALVSVRDANRSEAGLWRTSWVSELRAGSVEEMDIFCLWLLQTDGWLGDPPGAGQTERL